MNSFNGALMVINGIYHFSFLYLRNISRNLLPSSGQFDRVAIIFHSVCKCTFFPSWLRGHSSSLYTLSRINRSKMIDHFWFFSLSLSLFSSFFPFFSPFSFPPYLFSIFIPTKQKKKDRVLFPVACNRRDLSRDNL